MEKKREFPCSIEFKNLKQAKAIKRCLRSVGVKNIRMGKDHLGSFLTWQGIRGISKTASEQNCVKELTSCEEVKKKLKMGVPT